MVKIKPSRRRNDNYQLLVQTTLGNSLLSNASDVYVNLSDSVFLTKKAADLKEGEMLLFKNQGIETTLGEIEESLLKSNRYRNAREQLFVSLNGHQTTKFRFDMINSIARWCGVEDNLENKLFNLHGMEFSTEEYGKMVDCITEVMTLDSRINHQYVKDTIKLWLNGSTLAPHDWNLFNIFGSLNPEFLKYTLSREEGGIREDYHLFTVLRQGIMRYLSNTLEGQSKGRESQIQPTESISILPEAEIIMNDFVGRVNENYSLARVVNATRLSRPRRGRLRFATDVKLSKGVATQLDDSYTPNVVNYSDILNDINVMITLLTFGLEDYYLKTHKADSLIYGTGGLNSALQASEPTLYFLLELQGTSVDYINQVNELIRRNHLNKNFDEVTRSVYTDILNGNLDNILGIQKGQFVRAFNVYKRLLASMPREFLDNEIYFLELKKASKLDLRFAKASIMRKYGIDIDRRKVSTVTPLCTMSIQVGTGNNARITKVSDNLSRDIRDVGFMQEIKTLYLNNQARPFLTRTDYMTTAERYGCECLIKILPKTVLN